LGPDTEQENKAPRPVVQNSDVRIWQWSNLPN
jgi:hypothetical protein